VLDSIRIEQGSDINACRKRKPAFSIYGKYHLATKRPLNTEM